LAQSSFAASFLLVLLPLRLLNSALRLLLLLPLGADAWIHCCYSGDSATEVTTFISCCCL